MKQQFSSPIQLQSSKIYPQKVFTNQSTKISPLEINPLYGMLITCNDALKLGKSDIAFCTLKTSIYHIAQILAGENFGEFDETNTIRQYFTQIH